MTAPQEELQRVEGIGEQAALLLRFAYDAVCRARQSQPKERILNSVESCGNYFMQLLGDERLEKLYMLCLDAKGKLLACKLLSQGDVDSAAMSVRQVVSNALLYNASAVVLGHNHPSGVALPSREDRTATLQARDALAAVQIRLVDHIVVADGDYVSMAQSGFLVGDV